MTDKTQLLSKLRTNFNQWEALLASLSEEQLTARQLPGSLSIKDQLAHLWAWQQLSIARLDAALHHHDPVFTLWPPPFDPETPEGLNRVNGWIQQTCQAKGWEQIYQDWRNGFRQFLALAEAIPDADYTDTAKYPWFGDYPLSAVLAGSFEHHDEHLAELLAWKRRQ